MTSQDAITKLHIPPHIIRNSKINSMLTILMYNLKQTPQLPSPEQLSI
nr:MAG TPA: hypothetical protein [Caudoviricetes sp.]